MLVSLTGLITGANFVIIFISLIIVFFLLGLLFGRSMNNTKSSSKEKENEIEIEKAKDTGFLTDVPEKTQQPDTLVQDNRETTDRQDPWRKQNNNGPGYNNNYNNYNNYW